VADRNETLLKFADLPKADRKGREYTLENARVKSVSITNEDHGALTAWLHLEIGTCMGCGFGGFKLGNADTRNDDAPGTLHYMAEWVMRCINTLADRKYGKWEDLEGRPCRVLTEGLGGGVIAIGHFLQDKWFCPRIEFARKGEEGYRAAEGS
jgi:hypothetical protein